MEINEIRKKLALSGRVERVGRKVCRKYQLPDIDDERGEKKLNKLDESEQRKMLTNDVLGVLERHSMLIIEALVLESDMTIEEIIKKVEEDTCKMSKGCDMTEFFAKLREELGVK